MSTDHHGNSKENSPLRAAILGATGLVGSHVLIRLLNEPRYSHVDVIGRRAPAHVSSKMGFEQLELSQLSRSTSLANADHVFCCLGTTIAKAGSKETFRAIDVEAPLMAARTWAQYALASTHGESSSHQPHLARFLLVSAMGADPRSKVFYSRCKGELERELSQMLGPHLHIFRPSLLLGKRNEYRRGEVWAARLSSPVRRWFKGPLSPYRPIQAEAVAEAMCAAAWTELGQSAHVHLNQNMGQKYLGW